MATSDRRLRGRVARLFFVVVVATQLYFIVRGYSDPHKHFAFQPFNESDTFRSEIVRVTQDGRRIPITQEWFGYRWHRLVRERGVGRVNRTSHASSGYRSLSLFIAESLDWVAEHTPRDTETLYYEAEVTHHHNTRGPYTETFRSKPRELPPSREAAP